MKIIVVTVDGGDNGENTFIDVFKNWESLRNHIHSINSESKFDSKYRKQIIESFDKLNFDLLKKEGYANFGEFFWPNYTAKEVELI